MVTRMTEQPGPRDPAERRATDRHDKGTDVFGDLQRWFIRQSAKNMRREIRGQVRRTFGGGRETSDVWDTATNEIPPEVGESPECQWCPICRAARRMRDSGPGIGNQLSGAGDVVASAVQDAIGALDSLLARASGTDAGRESAARESGPRDSAPRDSASPDSRRERPGLVGLPGGADSAAGDAQGGSAAHANGYSPAGGPADRLATAPGTESDPWGAATEPTEASKDDSADAQSDGPGYGPDDRG
jgi:hypothetical protein